MKPFVFLFLFLIPALSAASSSKKCEYLLADSAGIDFGKLRLVPVATQIDAQDFVPSIHHIRWNPDVPSLSVKVRYPDILSTFDDWILPAHQTIELDGDTSRRLANSAYVEIPDKAKSASRNITPGLSLASLVALKKMIKADLAAYNIELIRDNFASVIQTAAPPVRLFEGPRPGSFIVTTSTPHPRTLQMEENESDEVKSGFVYLVNYWHNPNPLAPAPDYAFAALPKGFEVQTIRYNQDRIVLSDQDGRSLSYKYVVGSVNRISRSRLPDWMTGTDAEPLSAPLNQLGVFQGRLAYYDDFTGTEIQALDGRLFGLVNRDDGAYLRVVDERTNQILFEGRTGESLSTERWERNRRRLRLSGRDALAPLGVSFVLRAPATPGYANEGIKYVVVLTGGSVFTLSEKTEAK